MAISSERRTVLALLMVAEARLKTARMACKDEGENDASLGALIQGVADAVERAMAELKS